MLGDCFMLTEVQNDYRDLLEAIRTNQFTEEVLYLNGNELNDDNVIELSDALKLNSKIKRVDLSNNNITDRGIKALAELRNDGTKCVVEIDLSNNHFGAEGAYALAQAGFIKLDVSGNSIGDNGMSYFATCPTLTVLKARECGVSDTGVELILRSETIEVLDLGQNNFTASGLVGVRNNMHLVCFYLDGNPIGHLGATYLQPNTTLRILGLSTCNLGNKGAAIIAGGLPSLEEICAGDNNIGNLGAQSLARHNNLRSISLLGNAIEDDGAVALIQNPNIRKLNLAFNKIVAQHTAIQSALGENKDISLEGNPIAGILISYRENPTFPPNGSPPTIISKFKNN